MRRQTAVAAFVLGAVAFTASAALLVSRRSTNAGGAASFEGSKGIDPNEKHAPLAVDPPASTARTPSDTVGASENTKPVTAAEEVASTPEEGLRDFFGADWDRLRPLYEKRIPLAAALPGKLVPWAKVAGEVCPRMRVNEQDMAGIRRQYMPADPITPQELRDRYHVDRAVINNNEIIAVQARLQDLRSELEGALERFSRVVDARLVAKCANGDFDYAPYSNVENRHIPTRPVFLSSLTISDWVITYGVAADEDPGLPPLMNELKSFSNRVGVVIQEYFAERK